MIRHRFVVPLILIVAASCCLGYLADAFGSAVKQGTPRASKDGDGNAARTQSHAVMDVDKKGLRVEDLGRYLADLHQKYPQQSVLKQPLVLDSRRLGCTHLAVYQSFRMPSRRSPLVMYYKSRGGKEYLRPYVLLIYDCPGDLSVTFTELTGLPQGSEMMENWLAGKRSSLKGTPLAFDRLTTTELGKSLYVVYREQGSYRADAVMHRGDLYAEVEVFTSGIRKMDASSAKAMVQRVLRSVEVLK